MNTTNFEFAAKFFDISIDEAEWLFDPLQYGVRRGNKTVAARIRKFALGEIDYGDE